MCMFLILEFNSCTDKQLKSFIESVFYVYVNFKVRLISFHCTWKYLYEHYCGKIGSVFYF